MEHVYVDGAVLILSELKLIYEKLHWFLNVNPNYTPFCGKKLDGILSIKLKRIAKFICTVLSSI